MFFSQPQLAPGPQWVSKHLLQTGWRCAVLKVFSPSWLTEELFSLSLEIFSCTFSSPWFPWAFISSSNSVLKWMIHSLYICLMSVLGKSRERSLFPHAVVSALEFCVTVPETITSTCVEDQGGLSFYKQEGYFLPIPQDQPRRLQDGINQRYLTINALPRMEPFQEEKWILSHLRCLFSQSQNDGNLSGF